MKRLNIARRIGHLPRFPYRGRIISVLAPVKGDEQYSGIIADSNGLQFHIDTRSHIERQLYLYGSFEGTMLRALPPLFRALPAGRTVAVDVGANVGVYTLFLSRYFTRVFAVEPQAGVHARLKANLELNGIQNVHTFDVAAGERDGTAELHVPSAAHGNYGMATLGAGYLDPSSSISTAVRVVRLDNLLCDHLDSIGFVKIDVEGYELPVLKGMTSLLSRSRPIVQLEVVEWTKAQFGYGAEDIRSYFQSHDYVLQSPQRGSVEDVIAVPRENPAARASK